MTLSQLLDIRPGVTAVIGGGGKTTLLRTLGEELAGQHPVLLCTTTKILPFSDLPCARTAAELDELRRAHQLLCAGTDVPGTGKLTAPETPMAVLAEQFDYILVEADGAARRPLKAHAPHEPVIPTEANQTICVVGASGFGRPSLRRSPAGAVRASCGCAGGDGGHAGGRGEGASIRRSAHESLCQSGGDAVESGRCQGSGAPDGLSGSGRQSVEEGVFSMLVIIRGAGDLATGIALRLKRRIYR